MRAKTPKKIIVILILTAMFAGEVSVLAVPEKAKAQEEKLISVPIWASAGRIDSSGIEEISNTKILDSLLTGAKTAAINTAFTYFGKVLDAKMRDLLGIRSYLLYQQAVVETKYLLEAYASTHGENSVKNSATGIRAMDTIALGSDSENDFNGIRAPQSRELGAKESRSNASDAQKRAALQRLLVRASVQFTSSFICGGLNDRTIRNMASYMAGASIGYTLDDVDPRRPVEYYQRLGQLGSPEATPEFWVEGFRDMARQKESQAKSAAALELLTPSGVKTAQFTDASGKTRIYKPQGQTAELLKSTVYNIFKLKESADASPYNTSSFSAFVADASFKVAFLYAQQYIAKGLNKIGISAPPITLAISGILATIAASYASQFATKLYNNVAEMIFQGEVLTESGGCRRPSTRRRFTPADRSFNTNADFTGNVEYQDQPPVQPEPIALSLTASNTQISSGESVILNWNISGYPAGTTYDLTGGGLSETLTAGTGSRTVAPAITTTYTLTARNSGGTNSTPVTINVGTGGGGISLTFEQPTIDSDRMVRVNWDAGAPAGSTGQVTITPLPVDSLALSGTMCYQPTADEVSAGNVNFNMTAVVDENITQAAGSVSIISSPTRTFNIAYNAPTLTWDVSGYSDANVNINGNPVAQSGSQDSPPPGDYTLTVDEANGCGVIASQTVTVP